MPKCGTQICICDLPIRLDTYTGCAHKCQYCFVYRKSDINNIGLGENAGHLKKFIEGARTKETAWCDWNIPIHIGGMSDPFQPIEAQHKKTLEVLKVLAETQYPAVISTKGDLCIKEPWLSVLKECNVAVQVSMACKSYDKIETGAPPFEKRLKMLEILSKNTKRTIVRVQPYFHEKRKEIQDNIPKFKAAGAHGVIFEAMKFVNKKPGLIKVGGDYTYPLDILKYDFEILKQVCHNNDLQFLSGENRLRDMGDSLTCCGIEGLAGFRPNVFNGNHLLNGDKVEATEQMKQKGCSTCFHALYQDSVNTSEILNNRTFEQNMLLELQKGKSTRKILGKE